MARSPSVPMLDKSMNLHRTIYLVAAGILLIACSSQGEGERCVSANGNADCASGLVCISAVDLAEYERNKDYPEFVADRCCPVDANGAIQSSDPRCETKSDSTTVKTGTGGAAGATSTATTAGAAGSNNDSGAGGAAGESSSDGLGGTSTGAANESAGTAGAAGDGA
jgi:hypothetical protein